MSNMKEALIAACVDAAGMKLSWKDGLRAYIASRRLQQADAAKNKEALKAAIFRQPHRLKLRSKILLNIIYHMTESDLK